MDMVQHMLHDVNAWIARQGWDNLGVKIGEEFEYGPEDNLIVLPIFYNEADNVTDTLLAQFLYEYGLDKMYIKDMYTISFLHEIGHYFTLGQFTEEEWWEYIYQQEHKMPQITDNYLRNFTYWELPVEFAANMWLINWIEQHPDEFQELQMMLDSYMQLIIDSEDALAYYFSIYDE